MCNKKVIRNVMRLYLRRKFLKIFHCDPTIMIWRNTQVSIFDSILNFQSNASYEACILDYNTILHNYQFHIANFLFAERKTYSQRILCKRVMRVHMHLIIAPEVHGYKWILILESHTIAVMARPRSRKKIYYQHKYH